MPSWTEKWFNKTYLSVYQHRNLDDANHQLTLLKKHLPYQNPNKLFLDLGCGEGRYVHLLSQEGTNIVGLDASDELLKSGAKKYPHINLQKGDMRDFQGKYDVILSLFTSFGFFEDSVNQIVLENITRALNSKGLFWFDFLNKNFVIDNLVPKNEKQLPNGDLLIEEREINNNIVIKKITIIKNPSSNKKETYKEKVYLYHKEDIVHFLSKNNLILKQAYGNYFGDQWGENMPRSILLFKKE